MGLTNFPDGIETDELVVNGSQVVAGVTSAQRIAAGTKKEIKGTSTIVTGLTTVTSVTASLESSGAGAGEPFKVDVKASAEAGKIEVTVKQLTGANATANATVDWIAVGT